MVVVLTSTISAGTTVHTFRGVEGAVFAETATDTTSTTAVEAGAEAQTSRCAAENRWEAVVGATRLTKSGVFRNPP